MKNAKLKITLSLALGLICVVIGSAAHASEALAKKHGCSGCHAIDEKLVGPAFKDIGKRYATDKDAEATIIQTIQKGSVGKWGKIPMPANEKVGDADAKALAVWIQAAVK